RGAFGEVWLAEAPGGVVVAVKIIKAPEIPVDDPSASGAVNDEVHKFRQEQAALELTKNLGHPLLVRPHAYWVDNGLVHIAMARAAGSLQARLTECRRDGLPGVPASELLGYFQDVAAALDFLNERGLRHRDVKPANILLFSGYAKVADFGLTRETA